MSKNGALGPIVVENPWPQQEDEIQVVLAPTEKVGFGLGRDEDPPWYIEVGIEENGECYVDISSDSTECTERVFSYLQEMD